MLVFFIYIHLFITFFAFLELGDIHLFVFYVGVLGASSHTVAKTLTCMYCTTSNTGSKQWKTEGHLLR